MSEIIFLQQNNVVILRVNGNVSFEQIIDALKQYFPKVSKHLLWDYTNGNLSNVTAEEFSRVPDLAKLYLTNRIGGKTAFACPSNSVYGMFRMYMAYAEIKKLPYQYEVFRNFEDAINWLLRD